MDPRTAHLIASRESKARTKNGVISLVCLVAMGVGGMASCQFFTPSQPKAPIMATQPTRPEPTAQQIKSAQDSAKAGLDYYANRTTMDALQDMIDDAQDR
jgi:hypothetical protein